MYEATKNSNRKLSGLLASHKKIFKNNLKYEIKVS